MAKPGKKLPDPVMADRSYTTLQLCEAAQITPLIVRAEVRKGLKFVKTGRGRQFTGAAWIEHLRSKEATARPRVTGTDGSEDTP